MTDVTTTDIDTAPVDANMDLVRRFYDEIINGDNTAAVGDMVSEDFIDHIPNPLPGQSTRGSEAIAWFVQAARSAIPDVRVSIEDVIAAGDKVVTWIIYVTLADGASVEDMYQAVDSLCDRVTLDSLELGEQTCLTFSAEVHRALDISTSSRQLRTAGARAITWHVRESANAERGL